MTIYLATNSAKDVGGNYGTFSVAGTYDADYVSSAIKLKGRAQYGSPAFIGHHADVSADRISWVHFDMWPPTMAGDTSADGSFMRAKDADGDLIFYCSVTNGAIIPNCYDKAGASTSGGSFNFPDNTLCSVDILFSDDGVNALFEVYVDGVIVGTATRASTGIRPGLRTIQFDNTDTGSVGRDYYISQIIFANESTVGLKMQEILPSAVGNYSTLSATATEVADDDGTTGWTSDTVTDKQSFVVAGYTTPAARLIHSVMPGFAMRTGQTGPQNIRPFVRIGGVDYAAAADIGPVGNAKQGFVGNAWALNPATSAPWTAAEIAALDCGFEVKA